MVEGSSPSAPAKTLCLDCAVYYGDVKRLATDETETAVQEDTSRFSMIRFFREVKAEMKKVSWPSKKELISYTGIVFISVVFVCLLIWVYDTIFAKVLEVILR